MYCTISHFNPPALKVTVTTITLSPGKDLAQEVKPLPQIDSTDSFSSTEPDYDFTSDEFKGIPELVRTVISFEDDPLTPVLTFRAILLSCIFCILGSVNFASFRTTYAPFPVFFVILASDPLGRLLARLLPKYTVPLGRFSFSLNPGPWSIKEHAIVGIAANAGSQGQWATFLPTNAALYYGITMNPAVALFFGWQVTLYRSMDTQNISTKTRARQQMKGFWILLGATFVWQFLTEYLFPFVASLAPLCWFASRSHTVNFIGAGRGGMGLLNITLNWSNITSTVVTYPYHVQVIVFVTFCWGLIPIAYFGSLWGSPTYPIMSNQVFQKNRSAYLFNDLSTYLILVHMLDCVLIHVNETKYEEVGLAYSDAQYTWQMFMARKQAGNYHQDRLSRIIQQYPGLGKREWTALTLIPIIVLLGVVVSGKIYMPIWTYFVALGFGTAAMLPMSFVYALSGFSIKVGFFNELIYGYMIDAKGSSRHPLGQLAYRITSGNVWYDSRIVLEDQKIGHYLHIPPRQVIGIQIVANVLALPINYGVMRWVLATKFDYVSGQKKDLLGQWTGQEFQSYNTAGIQYALIGPKKLFASAFSSPSSGAFSRKFPRVRFNLWNTTIFFASAATFYGNLSTGPFTTFLVGTFTNFYLFRYRRVFWNKWAYIGGAALDTGFNANLLVERCFAL
ncbi:OPT oligopeptide transporter protein-domain-containing protein [Aspergillus keveii]|uniref:OPT oligopeptide transporter protein-domain-containing protein n=1 Tax=Aspergillus keveii TaxID=714993 RepID=A0ABR4FVC3_9EURO